MAMDLPRPKRWIDRLRFVQILRPHTGEESAEQFSNALQDEFAQVATPQDVHQLYLTLRADMEQMLLRGVGYVTLLMSLIAGVALAIARLT